MSAALTIGIPASAANLAWDQVEDERISHFNVYRNGELLYTIADPSLREIDVDVAGVTVGARYTMTACDALETICSDHSKMMYIPKAHTLREKGRAFHVSDGLGGFIDFLLAR